jgi:hypothetical protein
MDPSNGDGPPKQTGLVTNDEISSAASGRAWKYNRIATEHNGDSNPPDSWPLTYSAWTPRPFVLCPGDNGRRGEE